MQLSITTLEQLKEYFPSVECEKSKNIRAALFRGNEQAIREMIPQLAFADIRITSLQQEYINALTNAFFRMGE